MNKRIIQAFIVLIVILFGVSLISESNKKVESKDYINSFEQSVNSEIEVENGGLKDVHVIEEDSSNLISNVNAKIANTIVGGLNKLFGLGIKMIDGMVN